MTNVQITPTNKSDLKELAKIYTEAYNSLQIGEEWDDKSAHQLLLHLFETQPDLSFTARIDNKIVGAIVAIIKPWWDGNHITDGEIYIDPAYQRHGIGRALIKELFTEAKEKYGAKSWDTFTHVIHEYPLKWYQDMGFEEIEEWTMISGNIEKVLKNLN